MVETADFVAPGAPLRRFNVCLRGGGDPVVVAVEDRKPYTRKIVRHVEKTRELGDGRKKTDMVPEEVDYTYDFMPEMRADAVRAYNAAFGIGSAFSTKQLEIEDLGTAIPAPSVPVTEHPTGPMRSKALSTKEFKSSTSMG